MMILPTFKRLFFALVIQLLLMTPLYALDIVEIKWGFNNTVKKNEFNILSILVNNTSESPFEGEFTLLKNYGIGTVGAPLKKEIYISQFSTKWIQFYPYILYEGEEFSVKWHSSKTKNSGNINLTQIKTGEKSIVLLTQPRSFSGKVRIKTFYDNLFPPSAAVTGALDELVIDYVPKWESLKKKALMNWLKAGGVLHLLKSRDGNYPEFGKGLELLNNPSMEFRIAAGKIYRHDKTRVLLSQKYFDKKEILDDDESGKHDSNNYSYNSYNDNYNQFFLGLKRLNKTSHNWTLIYAFVILYILCLGPGNYFAGKKFKGYKKSIMLFLVLVFTFACVFAYIGKRGQGEKNNIRKITFAQSLGEGEYLIEQFINVFVTSGAVYPLTHGAGFNYYSSGQNTEKVSQFIANGKGGTFFADIPLFSSRTFLHKSVMKGSLVKFESVEFSLGQEIKNSLKNLKFKITGLNISNIKDAAVRYGDSMYSIKIDKNGLAVLNASTGMDFLDYFTEDNSYNFYEDLEEEEQYLKFFKPMIREQLGGNHDSKIFNKKRFPTERDHAQIFLYVKDNKKFLLKSSDNLGKESGYILYQFNLFKP